MPQLMKDDELLSPNANAIARHSIRRIIEESVVLIERDCEAAFKLKHGRSMEDPDRIYLRKLAMKMCVEYLNSALETMEHYQKP